MKNLIQEQELKGSLEKRLNRTNLNKTDILVLVIGAFAIAKGYSIDNEFLQGAGYGMLLGDITSYVGRYLLNKQETQ